MTGPDGQSYYDISLVDGYNIPMSIAVEGSHAGSTKILPANLTNPICIASANYLITDDFEPYADGANYTGTNSSTPLPFASGVTTAHIKRWCPWDNQLSPPYKPGNGVYPYPDDNIVRPEFDPCLSDCAKYNSDKYCCTGKYDSPSVCKPGLYSHDAKAVCPDAYTFAFDDQKSTFIIPAGVGFVITFCPSGQSTNIIATTSLAGQNVVKGAAERNHGEWWVVWGILGISLVWNF
jgi:beta-mannosidase